MPNPYAATINHTTTPQSESLFGRDQIQNAAGGYVFQLDPWDRLDRFLILGTEGGTYYATERAITRDNIQSLLALISQDGPRVVSRIVEISDTGRAPRNTPAIFALAACSVHGDTATKTAANAALPRVCRIGTHLFQWAQSLAALNGHGPSGAGQRRALARWYTDKTADSLAYDLAKYQQREGWAHRDLLRLCKPGSKQVAGIDPLREDSLAWKNAIGWATGHPLVAETGPALLESLCYTHSAESERDIVRLIELCKGSLTREMIPTQWLNSPLIWEALLTTGSGMPLTALIRNLGKLTSIGVIKPLSDAETFIVNRITSQLLIRGARLHPVTILNALAVYGSGRGVKGSLTWQPSQRVLTALEQAFDLSFATIEPSGKRVYIAIDGSGSMTGSNCIGLESLTCVAGASAMALVTARTESQSYVSGFDTRLKELTITARSSYTDVVKQLGYGGATDASIPFKHATLAKLPVDAFVVYTDNETWRGDQHPCVALDRYRQATGIAAKLVVVAMSATDYSIGDNKDAGTLNVVGFDSAAPSVIADFIRG